LVHLGVMHDPRDSGEDHHTWNLLGFQKLLDRSTTFGTS
jgi:UDP-glucose 4-epimerase